MLTLAIPRTIHLRGAVAASPQLPQHHDAALPVKPYLRTLSSPKYSLEKTEIIQLVNLLPDNLPLLNVVLPEVEERFEEGVGEEILEVVKMARGKEN